MKKNSKHSPLTPNWIQTVQTETVSTPPGVMKETAERIVQILILENLNLPLGSLIRFIQFYLNRAGKKLSQERRTEIEKAKRILQEMNSSKP